MMASKQPHFNLFFIFVLIRQLSLFSQLSLQLIYLCVLFVYFDFGCLQLYGILIE